MNSAGLVDLDEVAAYWKSRKLVDDNRLTYYIRWLSRFLIGPGANPRLSAADAQRLFIEGLERDGGVASWQIRQAARAVELYQKHYPVNHLIKVAGFQVPITGWFWVPADSHNGAASNQDGEVSQ